MKVEIFRIERTKQHTVSSLRVNGVLFCVTMERPWEDNLPYVSCIPCGCYKAKRITSPTFGETFEIVEVPGRTHILFHVANRASELKGCIAPGKYTGELDGERAVMHSGETYDKLMKLLSGVTEFDLFIADV